MRSFLSTFAAVATTAALTVAHAATTPVRDINVLQYDVQTQHAIFSLPCASCEAAQADLIFDLQPVAPVQHEGCQDVVDLVLNGHRLDLCFSKGYLQQRLTAGSSVLLDVSDSNNEHHTVNVTAEASSSHSPANEHDHDLYPTDIFLKVVSIDDSPLTPPTEVLTQLDILPERRLRTLLYHPAPHLVSFDKLPQSFINFKQPLRMETFDKEAMLDIEDELEVLRMLEADAVALKAELASRKLVVNQRFQKHIAHVPLKDLIEHCDGIMCAAKVIAGRLCDKMGVAADTPPDYSQINSHLQYMMDLSDATEKSDERPKDCAEGKKVGDAEAALSVSSEKPGISTRPVSANGTTDGKPKFVSKKTLHNPLVIALELLASILGLTALCVFLRRKCMSMRKRVERAADKEERRNARAYRRAARRALIRKKWDNFLGAISCFGSTKETKTLDYEEKRALILQDAFLEQDIDLAEKGEVMEAEIRELRNAHDIVAGLIGVDEHRYDLARHNTASPRHAYIPGTLSRRSTGGRSMGTLPSYTSEDLPDYTSTPDSIQESSDTVANGFANYTPTDSSPGRSRGPASSTSSSGSRRTRYTPVSSVLAISPRCSAETLRTRQSGEE